MKTVVKYVVEFNNVEYIFTSLDSAKEFEQKVKK